jgi:hypothetical protein
MILYDMVLKEGKFSPVFLQIAHGAIYHSSHTLSNRCIFFFDVSLAVHLSITLANDQLHTQILNTFIPILYMFQAISCSSSAGQTVLIQNVVSSFSVLSQPVHRTVTY